MLLVPSRLVAQNWVRLTSASDPYFVDSASLVRSEGLLNARVKWYPGASTIRFLTVQVDCRKPSLRISHELLVDRAPRRGTMQQTVLSPSPGWRVYPEGSDGKGVTEDLCRYGRARRSGGALD